MVQHKTHQFRSNKYMYCLRKFKEKIEENRKNIFFPQRYSSNKFECVPVVFHLAIIDDETNEILQIEQIHVEQKFWVYGLKKNLNLIQIISTVFTKYINNFTTVLKYKNKIILYDKDKIECILTKNLLDCDRLYQSFKTLIYEKKIYSFLFKGEITYNEKKIIVDELVKLTNLSRCQFFRNSTRH